MMHAEKATHDDIRCMAALFLNDPPNDPEKHMS